MNDRKEPKRYTQTVCFLCKNREVLLPVKTRRIGEGKRNGYGGNIRFYESIPMCALRELREESGGVTATRSALEKVAMATIYSTDEEGTEVIVYLHVYLVHEWDGEPVESEEMRDPRWFPLAELPCDEMMESDKHWLPLALTGQKMMVEAHLGPSQKGLAGATVCTLVDGFPY